MSSKSCSIDASPENLASDTECFKRGQVRFYGKRKIPKENLIMLQKGKKTNIKEEQKNILPQELVKLAETEDSKLTDAKEKQKEKVKVLLSELSETKKKEIKFKKNNEKSKKIISEKLKEFRIIKQKIDNDDANKKQKELDIKERKRTLLKLKKDLQQTGNKIFGAIISIQKEQKKLKLKFENAKIPQQEYIRKSRIQNDILKVKFKDWVFFKNKLTSLK